MKLFINMWHEFPLLHMKIFINIWQEFPLLHMKLFINIWQEFPLLHMKIRVHFLSHIGQFFLEREMFHTKVLPIIKTHT